jgi:CheY-like chemotaxis protein
LDASVRRKYGGSGLGLSICKKLCEAMGGEIECRSEVGKGSDFSFYVSLPPTTKQNYREAREGDESDSATTRQRCHPLATPPDASADEQKQIDDDDDELMESDELSDDDLNSDSSSGSSDDSIGEHHLNDNECDSDDDGDFEIEDEDDGLCENAHQGKGRDSAVARRHSSSSMLTKSLTIAPVRRGTRHSSGGPDLGRMIASASRRHKTDRAQGEADEERGRGTRRRVKRSNSRRASSPASTTAVLAAASASVAETIDSRRRMSASGGGSQHHKRSSMLVNARRASEQHGMTMRGAIDQHQPLRLMSSGRGYVADDDNNDDWFLGTGGGSSLLSSASSALSSPSSSFCSSSEISLPPLSESTAAAAARQRAAHFMMASSMDSNHQGLGDSSIPAAEATSPSSAMLAGLRRGSVPFGMSPTHRLLSSPSLTSMNPHHASMPTIPSLSSASDSPLPSPSLPPLPLNSSGAPPPSPSPSFSTTLASTSSHSSSALSISSAQHLLPTVGSRHLSLNSCASPRGIPRVRTSTPPRPSTPHGALFLPRSTGGTPPVPPLSLSKLGAKSAERDQSPATGAPRSFYVPSFPPEAMLLSPRSAPSAATPPRSTEEVYQDVMRGKRILVVEDNIINQKVALKMLSSFDCKVTVAENGLVAIKLFEESYREERRRHENGEPLYHAILMDIQMPVIGTCHRTARVRVRARGSWRCV